MSQGSWWIVACDGHENARETIYSVLKGRISQQCDETAVFDVPLNLKFGSLDQLIRLVDDLAKEDTMCEAVLRRLERQALEIDPTTEFRVQYMRNTLSVQEYLTRFTWDDAKYPRTRQIRDNIDTLHMACAKLDDEVRIKTATFTEIKTAHQNFTKQEGQNYNVRDLTDLLTPESVGHESFIYTEHLTTVLIVVSKGGDKEFLSCYEKLCENVVPTSALKVLPADVDGNSLWRVCLFKNKLDDFKIAARAHRYMVRDFEYSEENYKKTLQRRSKLEAEKTKQETHVLRFCNAAFSDVFTAWVHLKAMRLFVEAVLRYGVPPQFASFFIKLKKTTKEKKLRKDLDDVFTTSDSFGNSFIGDEVSGGGEAALLDSGGEYYRYVWLSLTPFQSATEK
eukprot:Selendium_serpulae@DN6028_c0_g1_i10.p1